jgi:hypothetical protein
MSERSMSQVITDAVKEFRSAVPECVAAGVVDMSTGMILALDTLDSHPAEVIDLVAAATFDLFQGRNVLTIENIFKQSRGVSSNRHYFEEILVNSSNLIHLFMRSSTNSDIVAVVVARRAVNLGMLFAQARIVMKGLNSGVA